MKHIAIHKNDVKIALIPLSHIICVLLTCYLLFRDIVETMIIT